MPGPRIEKIIGPAKRELFKALRAYNDAAVGNSAHRPFVVTIRDKGKIVGGVVADTYLGWMYVNVLWVSEPHRGNGYGQALMHKAEMEARERGIRNVFLDTFTAPKFYTKLGYREFGRLKDFTVGHDRIWLMKAL